MSQYLFEIELNRIGYIIWTIYEKRVKIEIIVYENKKSWYCTNL